MPVSRSAGVAAAALAVALLLPPDAAAAESYDGCAGFIDTVPVTLTTQGVWCLRHDLATAITSGAAIQLLSNNITVDCNGFKLGGLAAGDATTASGVYSGDRHNLTVRNCNIRGFRIGIDLSGTGHLVEDNRLDNNLATGIHMFGERHLIRRNAIHDTGGAPGITSAAGIYAAATIRENDIHGVSASGAAPLPSGIRAYGQGTEVRGNVVSGLVTGPSGGTARGIYVGARHVRVSDNHLTAGFAGQGIYAPAGNVPFCTGNTVAGFGGGGIVGCGGSSGNLTE